MYIYWGPGAINRNRTHNQSSAQVARGVTGVNIVKDVPKETDWETYQIMAFSVFYLTNTSP